MSFITDNGLAYLPPEGESVLPEAIDVTDDTSEDTAAYYGAEYALDIETGQFILTDDDEATTVEGSDAVLQSLRKALHTPMDFYLGYPPDYGNEVAAAFAEAPTGATVEDLALSYTADVIEADPRVSSVDQLDVTVDTEDETITATGIVVDAFGAVIELNETFPYAAHLP